MQNEKIAAMRLAGDVKLEAVLAIEGLLDSLERFFRGVVGFTQVGENHMAKSIMLDLRQQVPGFLVGEVAVAAFDTLLQRPGIGALNEHGGVVIGLQHQ